MENRAEAENAFLSMFLGSLTSGMDLRTSVLVVVRSAVEVKYKSFWEREMGKRGGGGGGGGGVGGRGFVRWKAATKTV